MSKPTVKSTLHPRKAPTQRRSRVTVDAIVEAATRILAREGPEALSTNRIAEVAGVSVGSVYQYFPNKEAIVSALLEQRIEDALTRLEASPPAPGAPLADAIRERVAIAAGIALDTARIPPGIGLFAPPAAMTAMNVHAFLARQFRSILEAHRGELAVDDKELAASFCAAALRGVLVAARQDKVSAPPESVISELTLLLVRYLTGRS